MPAEVLEKPASTVEDVAREVSKIRSIVTDVVEDGVRSARQAIKHGRSAAEDVIEEAQHAVKQRPLQANGIAFAAGVLAGAFWPGLDSVVVECRLPPEGRGGAQACRRLVAHTA